MRNLLICTITFLILVALASCTEIESITTLEPRITIEAYLIPGEEIQVVARREDLFGDSDTATYVNDLQIAISQDGENKIMKALSDGTYGVEGWSVKADATYELAFDYGGKKLSSTTTIPVKPAEFTSSATTYAVSAFTPGSGVPPTFPDPIDLQWSNPAGDYYLVVVKNIEEDPTEINSNSTRPPFQFRNEPNQGTSYQIRPQQFQYYGTHEIILFHLTPEYAALYQNNGSSSLNIKTPYSNIANGLGIFTSANADTVYLEVTKP